jgi:23S rRNA-/tRNA-specific pseudouridylate synthase
MLRLSATKQARGRRPHLGVTVLYVDRGVIVVNKPPGLVSQGNAATRSTAAAAVVAPAPPSQALAFNDVLEGKLRTFFCHRFHTVLVPQCGQNLIGPFLFFF